jgi:hypothetical protein
MRGLLAVVAVSGLMVAACSDDPTASEEYRELEGELVAAQERIEQLAGERNQLVEAAEASAGQSGGTVDVVDDVDLEGLAAAWGSGDVERIKAYYRDDAVMMPFGHILSTLSDHPMPEYWDMSGPDLVREAAEHDGANLEILTANQIGNMIVTTGQWTFPEGMFPDSELTVIKTADVTHLRGGEIWRVFGDFEVYVDGELVEM